MYVLQSIFAVLTGVIIKITEFHNQLEEEEVPIDAPCTLNRSGKISGT